MKVIGVMSGSSLDGVDLACVSFHRSGDHWKYELLAFETIAYDEAMHEILREAMHQDAEHLARWHAGYGHVLGEMIRGFMKRFDLQADLIVSHGHTIFHQPHHGFTFQLGDGASIYAETGIPVVSDMRSVDVALGGQGAPLVPVGERDLFPEYGIFLNLGGIANISTFSKKNTIHAFDISPCNLPLNILCEKYLGCAFDEKGMNASKGKPSASLLQSLQALPYFHHKPPKTLGREFIENEYLPLIEASELEVEDKLCTVTHHIAGCIAHAINSAGEKARSHAVMVTGGGVYNSYLLSLLKEKSHAELHIPSREMIEFKEAIIFAYLGMLRVTGEENTLSSVTQATRNAIGGAYYGPLLTK